MSFIKKSLRLLFKKRKNKEAEKLRWDLIPQAISEAQFASPGNDFNEIYPGVINHIENNKYLTAIEKKEAKNIVTKSKDKKNLIYIKGPQYPCDKCGRSGYTVGHCEHCLRDCLAKEFENWTSRNSVIDAAIRDSQILLPLPKSIIEWIPYEDISNVQYIGKGGCALVFSAVWKKGYIDSFDRERQKFKRSGPEKVALKQLNNSRDSDSKFLDELRVHILCTSNGIQITACKGVSRNPKTGDFILVMLRMEEDLRHFLQNSEKITWSKVYGLFWSISGDLKMIHDKQLIHRDLHPGNILRHWSDKWSISDLGLCGPPKQSLDSVYGNLPFIAPEVLEGKGYEFSADIYSFGMLMFEAATGTPPFNGREHDIHLQFDILDGIRPKTPDGLPSEYEALMKRCWDACPENRPTASDLERFFYGQFKLCTNDPSYGSTLVNLNTMKENLQINSSQSSTYHIISRNTKTTTTTTSSKTIETIENFDDLIIDEE